MSAVVCRKRSTSIFDELQYSHPSASKRIRFSPDRCASLSFTGDSNIERLNHLRSLFPDMDQQYLERALEASGNDLDSAIKSLNDLCLEAAANKVDSGEADVKILSEASGEESAATNIPKQGSEWVELFVREMMSASNIDDARARASGALEVLEKSIIARVNVEAAQNFVKENMILKEQVEVLLRENTFLKSAVAIQHGRQKDYDEKNQELQHLKQLVLQYQEQLSKLEVNNYALAMHLRQAQQGCSIPGKFHPDIF